jgi:hypothetical protein
MAYAQILSKEHLPNGDEHLHPNLPVSNSVPEKLRREFVCQGAGVLIESTPYLLSLFQSKKCRRFRIVMKEEIGANSWSFVSWDNSDTNWHSSRTNYECQKALQNENPAPASFRTNSVHLDDGPGQQSPKCSSNGRSREEQRLYGQSGSSISSD